MRREIAHEVMEVTVTRVKQRIMPRVSVVDRC